MRIFILCLLSITFSSLCGQYTLSGIVTNDKGEKLDAAIVYVEGTTLSTISDSKGNYLLTNIPAGQQLIYVTYLGYEKNSFNIDLNSNTVVDVIIEGKLYKLDEIEVITNRIQPSNPFTYSMVDRKELDTKNLGQDIPFLLNNTPSAVVTSDAGNGIGYTGLRIRGTDQSRINVTINGIPINDAESQGVFWVNMPDLAGSVSDIQVQRGVGPSTNGPGAYGGSVSVNTQDVTINPNASISGTFGSFNTNKLGINLGTGLINNKFLIDARYSLINSDGYIDRASSALSSYYLSAARVTSKSSLRFITFSGKERTYQSWNGTPEAKVNGDQVALLDHYYNNLGSLYNTVQDSINLFNSDRKYNYYQYKDQVDDYQQSHYQLHYSYDFASPLSVKGSLYYTKGKGFFEQFKFNDDLSDYKLPDIMVDGEPITSSDLVRRRWLDNDLFGGVFSAKYEISRKFDVSFGAGASTYTGGHFGNVIAIALTDNLDKSRRYYDNTGKKLDANSYIRANYETSFGLHTFVDVQLRNVHYSVAGSDSDLQAIDIDTSYLFFNPKVGVSYDLKKGNVYGSLAVANREPDRSDFLDNPRSATPLPESLLNYEFGYKYASKSYQIGTNIYLMDYKNQLVQTGDLNDVGSVLRANVANSYRLGLELEMNYNISQFLLWNWNAAFSKNKIAQFNEVLFDYTNGFEKIETNYKNVDIAFSPSIILKNNFVVFPVKDLAITLESQYVGKQYLDNTQSNLKSLKPYFVNNIRFNYSLNPSFINKVDLTLMLNNVLNTLYSANGYSYSYIYGDKITENFLYPQAGFNFLLGATVKF